MAALGHPIVGDQTYGAGDPAPRPLLHALSLELSHPRTGRPKRWETPPPADFLTALKETPPLPLGRSSAKNRQKLL
jgi:23S rRNA pseudouridine1911/1915/1917 synthase